MCSSYLKEWQDMLGDMNVVTVKMRECLLDSYIGKDQCDDLRRMISSSCRVRAMERWSCSGCTP